MYLVMFDKLMLISNVQLALYSSLKCQTRPFIVMRMKMTNGRPDGRLVNKIVIPTAAFTFYRNSM